MLAPIALTFILGACPLHSFLPYALGYLRLALRRCVEVNVQLARRIVFDVQRSGTAK